MSEKPQDPALASSAHPSATYTALKHTAQAFVAGQSHKPALAARMDFEALRALTSSSFVHSFGPAYSVAQAPKLQGQFDFERFQAHLQGMLPMLERWEIEEKGLVVDERGRSVVVRASYRMFVKGGEGVENDVVWWLELEEEGKDGEGGGWKVRKSTEIVDFGASTRIRELMMGGT
ncbi:hypothetical protein N0V86_008633 [Didymella sp. IMI 355093]|nr:hypothetical protein N0V86_008633 [Didymella sp. IMI 355093]